MSEEPSRINISVGEVSIDIEGSEDFVSEQLSSFRELIKRKMERHSPTMGISSGKTDVPEAEVTQREKNDSVKAEPELPIKKVYHTDDEGNFYLTLRKMPGGSTAERMDLGPKSWTLGFCGNGPPRTVDYRCGRREFRGGRYAEEILAEAEIPGRQGTA